MHPLGTLQRGLGDLGRAGLQWSASWWSVVHVGALTLVLALSPSSYRRENRSALARHVVFATAPHLLGFTLLSALISVVLARILVVTAAGYGLSQYALEMVVRVLVLELIPLTAALFVALRCTVPSGAELTELHARGAFDAQIERGLDPLRHELLPRVVAGIFAVLLLAAISCALALVIAYVAVYGAAAGGFGGFTRTVGRVFEPGVAAVFAVKTLLFGLAVSLIPVAAFLRGPRAPRSRTRAELDGLVRMFTVILLIEIGALMTNYA